MSGDEASNKRYYILEGIISKRFDDPSELIKVIVISIASLVFFIAVWWGLANYFDSEFLPPPEIVWDNFWRSFNTPDPTTSLTMDDHIWASLKRLSAGFGLAFIAAIPLGMVMGYSRAGEVFAKPMVEVFRPIAPIAWAPLFLAAFGFTNGPILVVFIGVFFPLLSNIIFGVKKVEPILKDAARTLGAKDITIFTKVIFPSTIPFMMTGIKIGLGIGWMCIVAAEMIAAVGGGVGRYIIIQTNFGLYDRMFAGLVVIALLGLITTELAGYIEKWVSKRMGLA